MNDEEAGELGHNMHIDVEKLQEEELSIKMKSDGFTGTNE